MRDIQNSPTAPTYLRKRNGGNTMINKVSVGLNIGMDGAVDPNFRLVEAHLSLQSAGKLVGPLLRPAFQFEPPRLVPTVVGNGRSRRGGELQHDPFPPPSLVSVRRRHHVFQGAWDGTVTPCLEELPPVVASKVQIQDDDGVCGRGSARPLDPPQDVGNRRFASPHAVVVVPDSDGFAFVGIFL